MQAINISGKVSGQDFPLNTSKAYDDIFTAICRQEISVEAVRSGGTMVELANLDADALLEVEFEGGYKRWLRAGDLRAQTHAATSRSATQDFLLTPASFADGAQRGVVSLVLKYLRLVDIDPIATTSEALAAFLIEQLETRKIPTPGIYRCANPNQLELLPIDDSSAFDVSKPILLFIHGTFSSTDGSFGELWESHQGYNAPAWLQRLFTPYGTNVFALEHRTLTVSPVHNALQVLRLLPAQARLHLISYSRGGLVGELLCQGKLQRRTAGGEFAPSDIVFTPEELTLFQQPQRQQDFADLQEIAALLVAKRIHVERFVRIASPSRGTVLASERLEDNLSLLFNVLSLIPAPRFHLLAEYVRMVLLATARKRTDPAELPGLEAMLPSSPLVRLLNRPEVRLDSDLTVIAGDVKGSRLLGKLKEWALQRFFGEANDFVVNTAAMYGGAQRVGGTRFYLDQRDETSHFGYFRNQEVHARIISALTRPEDDLRLLPLRPTTRSNASKRSASTPPQASSTVYFLPGLLGSSLALNAKPVWLDISALSWGYFSELQYSASGVAANGVLESAYGALLDMLAVKHRLVTFPYDWRRSYHEAGQRLGEALNQELDAAQAAGRKAVLRLLAHSTGGLVVIAMQSALPALWQRLCKEADCRIIMLGTPLQGTYTAVQWLLGQHRLLPLLSLLAGQSAADGTTPLAKQFAGYPGILELLPAEYLQAQRWEQVLGNDFPAFIASNALAQARKNREQWAAVALDPQRLMYLHGKAALTPVDLQRDPTGQWRCLAGQNGDGVTAWVTLPAQLPTWFMPVEHGRMASHPEYFQALQYLLDDGVSRQLEQRLPTIAKTTLQWLPSTRPELFPDEAELLGAALGYTTYQTHTDLRPAVAVQVIHGNLEHVPYPIVLGHYEGDAILSAEAILDKRLNGKLSELQRMNLYPGAIGTSEVILNPGKRPGGAIVVGLGEVGKLTLNALTASFNRAMLAYAMHLRSLLEQQPPKNLAEGEAVPVHIASLLLGTVGGGSMTLADAITAIFRAIASANQTLQKTERGLRLRLQSLDFIELYEDRAVEAARLVQDFVLLPEFRNDFTVKSLMQTLPGKRRRVMYNEPPGWWRRIQVTTQEDGSLKYTALTDKARAETQLQATQRKLVEQFIQTAVNSNADDPDTGKILFELLLPSAIKEQAPNAANLVLVLDDKSSAYPWELLYNRLDHDSQPLAVRFGLVRQLITGQYRQRVLTPLERSALVIGDPPVNGEFVRLPAARQEAENVASLLEAGGFTQVNRQIGTDAQSVLKALHSGDYRVLHLAGHGVYRYPVDKDSGQMVSGLVLGDGLFLTAVEIEQMRKVPELVFINCCHLAQMDFMEAPTQAALTQNRNQLAASFAQALIKMGVKAVIAAGWAIDDAAAQVFAEHCYNALLQGHTFGAAVLQARQETWRQYSSGNTWGAYQCYGDPDYKLLSRQPKDEENPLDHWRFVADVEVVAEIQNLIHAAETARKEDTEKLQSRLQQLHRAIPTEWLGKADILYALGRAYGKLDMFAPALAAYQAALDSPQADYPVLLLEDTISLQTGWALAAALGEAEMPPRPPAALMTASLNTLTLLEGLGNSLQRLEETGKLWKRQAMMSNGTARQQALAHMDTAYQRAHQFALQESQQVAPYPLLNWLTCRVVRYLRGHIKELDQAELTYWLEQARQAAEAAERQDANFCSGITQAEYLLLRYILSGRLQETAQVKTIITTYAKAIGRGATPRQIRFVREHLVFLHKMLAEFYADKPPLATAVIALLEIQEKLAI